MDLMAPYFSEDENGEGLLVLSDSANGLADTCAKWYYKATKNTQYSIVDDENLDDFRVYSNRTVERKLDSLKSEILNQVGGETTEENWLYNLETETTFNGTSDYIDTGIQLCKEDKSFTVLLDAVSTGTNARGNVIFYCSKEENPYIGYAISWNTTARVRTYSYQSGIGYIDCTDGVRFKIALVRDVTAGTVKYFLYQNGMLLLSDKNSVVNNVTPSTLDVTAKLGSAEDSVYGDSYWSGTIYECKISDRAFSDSDVLAWFEGTYSPSGGKDYVTRSELEEEMPEKLPNPHALTFAGAVTGT